MGSLHRDDDRPGKENAKLIDANVNVVLQVHKSHLCRVEDFIDSLNIDAAPQYRKAAKSDLASVTVKIVSTNKKTVSKSCSTVFISVSDIKVFSDRLAESKFIFQALNKSYVLLNNRSLLYCSIGGDDDSFGECLTQTLQKSREENAKSKMVVKVDTFPPKLQAIALKSLMKELDKKGVPPQELDVSPSNYTHTLSIILLDQPKKSNGMSSFLIGISPAECTLPSICKIQETANDDVCRAQYKLAEAFERYLNHYTRNGWPFHSAVVGSKRKNVPVIGVDCGAAPGGWTKYLIEQTACDEVYSIDPGNMSESVSSLPNVNHLQMTGEMALSKLGEILSQKEVLISIWVSDMCVHDVSKQVDMFLRAKRKGIFNADLAFVLTIKCNIGHAKERFDELARKEVNRLEEAGAYDVMVVHLFSNRIGERTVIGFLK